MKQDKMKSLPAEPEAGGRNLRFRAEEKLSSSRYSNTESLTPREIETLLHELRVHQIELEMQNEELRHTQEALEKSRDEYINLYDFAPLGYITVSAEGIILQANLTAAAMLGLPRGQLIKKPITLFISREDQDIYYLHRKALFDTGEPQICEMRMRRESEDIFWGRLEAVMGEPEKNAPPACRIVFSDITEHKQAEEKQEKLKEELNQARKIETIGRLAGGVAHDFNNMLGVILGYTEMAMLQTPSDSPLLRHLTEIQKASQSSAELVRQLLAFARKQPILPRILDMNHAVNEILEMLHRLVGENIELICQAEQGPLLVEMDPLQIHQILTNLIANSRDAIRGHGKIVIKSQKYVLPEEITAPVPEMPPGDYLLLSVTDDGQGMSRESVNRMFEPYYTTKPMGKGTGLGMAMVYGIVKQNHGHILVTSKTEEGSEVKIYFPKSNKPADLALKTTQLNRNSASRGIQILLVEDNETIIEAMLAMLENLGYNTISAASPLRALELAEENAGKIDLLLTDVIMPQMNGRELAKRLLKRFPELKVLYMSGYTADIITQNGVLEDSMVFLPKPFLLKDLAAKIEESLGNN